MVMVLLSVGFVQDAAAQTWAEIFKQSKTQKKYLVNQIAALQVYLGYARQGYELVGNGLDVVRDISKGEFSLHNAFISSLKQVSPAIRNDLRVSEIISMQLAVLKLSGGWGNASLLNGENRDYISGIRADLRSKCLDVLEALLMIITAGKVEMGDEERLRRIGELYQLMNQHLSFAREFTAEVNLLVSSRQQELIELGKIGDNYEKDN